MEELISKYGHLECWAVIKIRYSPTIISNNITYQRCRQIIDNMSEQKFFYVYLDVTMLDFILKDKIP